MTLILALLFLVLPSNASQLAHPDSNELPQAALIMLNRKFPGWKLHEVSAEVRQFFQQEMNGVSPVVILGDFDGNRRLDYAALIQQGRLRYYLVVFLRRRRGYEMYVIRNPDGEYLALARKGTGDYNYDTQKDIIYVNDAILTGILEKGGSSYVYKNGRFVSFVSSD